MITDKHAFKNLAIDLVNSFRDCGFNKGLYFKNSNYITLRKSFTDGWFINLGKEKSRGINIHLWYDRWSAYYDRKLWYGLFTKKLKMINKISNDCLETIGKPIELTDEDILEYYIWNKSKLKNKIPMKYFGRPFVERYYDYRAFFYGIYESQPIHNNNVRIQIINRIMSFYSSIFEKSKKSHNAQKELDTYPRFENRTTVISHLRRERSQHLSTLRKQLDDYRCQICKLKFSEVYGILGRNFAEAHHKIPLSKLDFEITTSVDDLITVCSNCHRMLHKLKGEKNDVKKLILLMKRKI